MIKPVNVSSVGIDPIKVPHQNNVSFSGVKLNAKTVKKGAQKVFGEEFANKLADRVRPYYKKAKPVVEKAAKEVVDFAKKVPGYLKKAGKFVGKKIGELASFIKKSISDSLDVTKNSAKKSRQMKKLAIALGATAGAGGVTKKAIKHKKSSN